MTMDSIVFENVVPAVFSAVEGLRSDVWGCRLELRKGCTYLIEAASGKGKSTFCSYLVGYRSDYSGKITFDGGDIRGMKAAGWSGVRKGVVSLMFQELRLFPELTALENVEIKNSLTGHRTRSEIEGWFERLGIADKLNSPVGLMSFGQQQRVALARALAQPFDFLVADEPVSHLDDDNAAAMAILMEEEARRQGAAIVATSIGKHAPLAYGKVLKL